VLLRATLAIAFRQPDDVHVTGWTRRYADGTASITAPDELPINAVADLAAITEHEDHLYATIEPARRAGTSLADLIALMRTAGFGRPSTYADAVTKLAASPEVIYEGDELVLTDFGERRAAALRAPNAGAPVLDSAFNVALEGRLDALERGVGEAADVLALLGHVLSPQDREALGWLETYGDDFVGETAAQHDARLAGLQPAPSPFHVRVDDVESALAGDDPIRIARDRIIEEFESGLRGWWSTLSATDRSGVVFAAILANGEPGHVLLRRARLATEHLERIESAATILHVELGLETDPTARESNA
jgi:hypothetical protein